METSVSSWLQSYFWLIPVQASFLQSEMIWMGGGAPTHSHSWSTSIIIILDLEMWGFKTEKTEEKKNKCFYYFVLFWFTSCVECSNLISFELVEIGHSFHFGRNDSTSSSGELVRVLGNTYGDLWTVSCNSIPESIS